MNPATPPLLPDAAYWSELTRPWKLFTFTVAMALLLYGALVYDVSDWDVGVTFIMGILTYVSAPWVVETLATVLRPRGGLRALPRDWPLRICAALLVTWFVVDGAYWLWHTAVGNVMLRQENLIVSSLIYLMAGLFWLYRGTLRELMANLTQLLRR